MLQRLYVKNLALIDEIEVEFEHGLNILTGETGAGKTTTTLMLLGLTEPTEGFATIEGMLITVS